MVIEPEPSALSGETLGKKFLVRRVIGTGGMGVVYEVEHLFTKRIGALKLLYRTYAALPDVVERFVREASAAGRIHNAHIVETMDAGELPSGEPYIFMELLAGSPVRDLIRNRGRIPFHEATQIVSQAAEGLAAAHRADIVHRDIKPDNLFLCDGAPPFVKILDFGISKFSRRHTGDYRLTVQGAPMGTPYYMSPEQVVGKEDVDARTDIYSLGVVLYECLAGKVPFDADTLPALSIKIFEGNYTPLTELVADAPKGIDELMKRAMAADPRERYADMSEFRHALDTLATSSETPRLAPRSAVAPHALHPSTRARRRWWIAAVIALGCGAAFAFFARRPVNEEPQRTDSSSSAQPRAPQPRPAAASRSTLAPEGASSAALSPTPSLMPSSSGATSAAVSSKRLREKALRAVRHDASAESEPKPSRAAKDGLSEQNPFD